MDHLLPPLQADLDSLKKHGKYRSSYAATNCSSSSHTRCDHTREPSAATSLDLENERVQADLNHVNLSHSQTLTAVSGSNGNEVKIEDGFLPEEVTYKPGERITPWLDSDKDHVGSIDLVIDRVVPAYSNSGHVDLGEAIRDAMLPTARPSPTDRFLPYNQLQAIVTADNIILELKRAQKPRIRASSTLDYAVIAEKVLQWQEPNHGGTNRRALFAILCLLDMALAIEDFITSGFFDQDLPFSIDSAGILRRYGSCDSPITLFDSWTRKDREQFHNYQGSILLPFFEFSKVYSSGIGQHNLAPFATLPFIGDENAKQAMLVGGFSTVRKVHMHDAHHDLAQSPLYLAVKELRYNCADNDAHERLPNPEVAAFQRLNHLQHSHIIQLLATYTQNDRLHIMFPWADSNLYDFWCVHFPKTSQIPRGAELARWMSRQVMGLSDAIHQIHHLNVNEFNIEGSPAHDQLKTHGRHGDIKPENILWFKEPGASTVGRMNGTLKISDLGSADFRSSLSKSVDIVSIRGFTDTYKAPEFDMNARISPRYDVWSFGCVLMQFVVWYLDGAEGVKAFSKRRMSESGRRIQADDFFNIYSDETKTTTRAKLSVQEEFDRLRRHQSCSDFILDLLYLIQSDLLRLTSAKRARCDQIARDLRQINERCEKDSAYCTRRSYGPIRKVPTDLSDSVVLDLSTQMSDEYKATSRGSDNIHLNERPTPDDSIGSSESPFDDMYSISQSSTSCNQNASIGLASPDTSKSTQCALFTQKQSEVKNHNGERPFGWVRRLRRFIFGCFCLLDHDHNC